MDPTADLKEQLELSKSIEDILSHPMDPNDVSEVMDKAERLSELVQALDEWLLKGGFLPEPWKKPVRLATERWKRLIRLKTEMCEILDSYDHALVNGVIQGLEDEQFEQLIERAEILSTALAGVTNDLRIRLESELTAQEKR